MEKIFFLVMSKYRIVTGSILLHRRYLLMSIITFVATISLYAQSKIITINAAQVKATVQPTMWGVFFEDINMGADGGIYAELVKNRSFEFYKPMMGWNVLGKPLTEGDFLVMSLE